MGLLRRTQLLRTSAVRTTDFTPAANTDTGIPWTSSVNSNDSSWVVGSPTRITINAQGTYLIQYHVPISQNAAAQQIAIFVRVSGGGAVAPNRVNVPAVATTLAFTGSAVENLSVGAYLEVIVNIGSGGVSGGFIINPTLVVTKIGKL